MKPGWMYILLCENGSYYTGSTIDLARRLKQHIDGKGANHTKKYKPIDLAYSEYYSDVRIAFKREKQIQKWRREKKEALIFNNQNNLPELAKATWQNCSQVSNSNLGKKKIE